MNNKTSIELLAPARDLSCGIAAVDCGADAVYIGGPSFGARVNAGNSIEDLAKLCDYAHQFGVKIHVTLNTILSDLELKNVQALLYDLYAIGVDALIIQDLGILSLDLPPFELHASTQQNNSTPEKARFLDQLGFSQIVLARELSIHEIKEIKKVVKTAKLEFFVHGALCVGVSGRCYLSQCVTNRSANRGECAQLCRVAQSLRTAKGEYLAKDQYLLSMRDLNNTNNLEELMEAGVQSFKIEGRLKDEVYVRNVTAWYRQHIDQIIENNSNRYARSSYGRSTYNFIPDVNKSFNRGFTEYNLHEIKDNYANFNSPKFVGTPIAKILKNRGKELLIEPKDQIEIHNGDKCNYFNSTNELDGFRISSYKNNIIEIFKPIKDLKTGTILYRNKDADFEKRVLDPKAAQRKLKINFFYAEFDDHIELKAQDEMGDQILVSRSTQDFTLAQDQNKLASQINDKLKKLGTTIYEANEINLSFQKYWFIPISKINEMRHEAIQELVKLKQARRTNSTRKLDLSVMLPKEEENLGYQANIYNHLAKNFYKDHGEINIEDAYEINKKPHAAVLFSKHCLRYCFGMCEKRNNKRKAEKLELIIGNQLFRLDFDCNRCMMILRDQGKIK